MTTNYRDFDFPSAGDVSQLVSAAKRERALYVASLIGGFLEKLARFGGTVRETAVACTAARLHLN